MFSTFKKCEALILALLTMILTGYSFSEEKIELSIISNKHEIVQYEPLIINFQLKNSGTTDWQINGVLSYEAGWLQLEIGEFGGKFYHYDTGTHATVSPSRNLLKPKQLLLSQVILFTYKKSTLEPPYTVEIIEADPHIFFPFGEPGIYKLRAFYQLGGNWISKDRKPLESNTLEIKVLPWNQKEQEAFDFFKKVNDLAHAMGACCPDKYGEEAKIYEDFINLYPNTVYTSYVKFTLAERYHYGTGPIPGEGKNFEKAHKLYSDLAKSAPLFLADHALYSLARLEVESGRLKRYYIDEKRNIFDDLKERDNWDYVLWYWGSFLIDNDSDKNNFNNYIISIIDDNPEKYFNFIRKQHDSSYQSSDFNIEKLAQIYNIIELSQIAKKHFNSQQLSPQQKEVIDAFIKQSDSYMNEMKDK